MHHIRHRITRPMALLGLMASLTLALAACDTSVTTGGNASIPNNGSTGITTSSSTTTPKPPQLTHLSDYCKLVSTADVARITNLAITQVVPVPNDDRHIVACGYAASLSNPAGAVIFFFVPLDSGQTQSYYTGLKQQAQSGGATVTDLSGIGDAAFATSQNGVDAVITRKGAVVFTTSGPTHQPLPLAVDKQLAMLVASKL